MPLFRPYFLLSIILLLFTALRGVAEIETPEMGTILPEVRRLAAKYGAENVLVVFDFDNTCAETSTDLASEVWFTWALAEVERGRPPYPGVTHYGDLVALQAAIFEKRPMQLVEKGFPAIVAEIQAMNVHAMLETSRNPALFPSTRDALKSFGVDFEKTAPGPEDPRSFSPHPLLEVADVLKWGLRSTLALFSYCDDRSGASSRLLEVGLPRRTHQYACGGPPAAGARSCSRLYRLTTEKRAKVDLRRRPLPVHYEDGLYMTQGQHKGGMLRALFNKIGWQPKAIVFVDDKAHHLASVREAFDGTAIETLTVRYSRTDEKVRALAEGDLSHAQRELAQLAPEIDARFQAIRCSSWLETMAY